MNVCIKNAESGLDYDIANAKLFIVMFPTQMPASEISA